MTDHLDEARAALTDREWKPSPDWRAVRGVDQDPVLEAWSESVDARAMLRVLEHLSHVQSQRGCFLARATRTVEHDSSGRSTMTGADDWRVEPTGLFRVRFMDRDGGHVEYECDNEIVDEIRKRFPVVTVADVLDERCRIHRCAWGE